MDGQCSQCSDILSSDEDEFRGATREECMRTVWRRPPKNGAMTHAIRDTHAITNQNGDVVEFVFKQTSGVMQGSPEIRPAIDMEITLETISGEDVSFKLFWDSAEVPSSNFNGKININNIGTCDGEICTGLNTGSVICDASGGTGPYSEGSGSMKGTTWNYYKGATGFSHACGTADTYISGKADFQSNNGWWPPANIKWAHLTDDNKIKLFKIHGFEPPSDPDFDWDSVPDNSEFTPLIERIKDYGLTKYDESPIEQGVHWYPPTETTYMYGGQSRVWYVRNGPSVDDCKQMCESAGVFIQGDDIESTYTDGSRRRCTGFTHHQSIDVTHQFITSRCYFSAAPLVYFNPAFTDNGRYTWWSSTEDITSRTVPATTTIIEASPSFQGPQTLGDQHTVIRYFTSQNNPKTYAIIEGEQNEWLNRVLYWEIDDNCLNNAQSSFEFCIPIGNCNECSCPAGTYVEAAIDGYPGCNGLETSNDDMVRKK